MDTNDAPKARLAEHLHELDPFSAALHRDAAPLLGHAMPVSSKKRDSDPKTSMRSAGSGRSRSRSPRAFCTRLPHADNTSTRSRLRAAQLLGRRSWVGASSSSIIGTPKVLPREQNGRAYVRGMAVVVGESGLRLYAPSDVAGGAVTERNPDDPHGFTAWKRRKIGGIVGLDPGLTSIPASLCPTIPTTTPNCWLPATAETSPTNSATGASRPSEENSKKPIRTAHRHRKPRTRPQYRLNRANRKRVQCGRRAHRRAKKMEPARSTRHRPLPRHLPPARRQRTCKLGRRNRIHARGSGQHRRHAADRKRGIARAGRARIRAESVGISDELRAVCPLAVYIPQYGSTRSLNVAAAAAIAQHEWVRQHRTPRGSWALVLVR